MKARLFTMTESYQQESRAEWTLWHWTERVMAFNICTNGETQMCAYTRISIHIFASSATLQRGPRATAPQ